ncbi:MAG: hydantoinase/oxoprolinase family protein, partial [Gammaproteobacteria bacterium]|nr:hydantoinase/oxoprolinase family protein [Gammaproteobacteria bacterium]
RMALRLGIDTGGTYTDAVVFDDRQGVLATTKVLTRHHDLAACIGQAIREVMSTPLDLNLAAVSTTLATNALVEGHGGDACLIMLGQKPQALRRAGLEANLAGSPVVFVDGGHNANGDPLTLLDEESIARCVREYADKVQAFAVAGLFAVRNPEHERRAREIIAEHCDLPVTCGHELSAQLDAPRRALTAFLNARLVPLLSELIDAVQETLNKLSCSAPLMVVKGDGSLVSADTARQRPVETILSGPAASTIGARHLSGERNAIVVDLGGTTTDIGILRDGWPALTEHGAHVAGLPTMVAAIDAHTYGLGGDSEVHCSSANLQLGPQRAVPVSLLANDHPHISATLQRQLERGYAHEFDARFALRRRATGHEERLTYSEREIWRMLADGPLELEKLHQRVTSELPLARLRARGLVAISAFTPSDAAHVLGMHHEWSRSAATAAALLTAQRAALLGGKAATAEDFSRAVIEALSRQSCEVIVDAVLRDEGDPTTPRNNPLLKRALRNDADSLLRVRFALGCPLIAIGAAAPHYYPLVAKQLGANLVIPEGVAVANAIGAAVSGILQRSSTLITLPRDACFRVHSESGTADFGTLNDATEFARATARDLAVAAAHRAGAGESVQCDTQQQDTIITGPGGHSTFLQSRITVIARGRPPT